MKTARTANSAQTQQRMHSARPRAGSVRATAPARASTRSPTARSAAPNAADPYATAGPSPRPARSAAVSRARKADDAAAATAAPATSSRALRRLVTSHGPQALPQVGACPDGNSAAKPAEPPHGPLSGWPGSGRTWPTVLLKFEYGGGSPTCEG